MGYDVRPPSNSKSNSKDETSANLVGFKGYLISFEGGDVKPEQANRHAVQSQFILKHIQSPLDTCTSEVSTLIDIKRKEGVWSANTCRAYLNSLRLYVIYIRHMASLGQPNFLVHDLEKLSSLLTSISTWTKSLKKAYTREAKDKVKFNGTALPNPNDFAFCLQGERSKMAKELLQKNDVACTMTNHTIVRNYLVMQLLFSSACRSGCIENMTLEQLKSAPLQSGSYLVRVTEHKTASSYGSAELIVAPDLYKDMNTYLEQFRPKSTCGCVFLTWSGQPLDSGALCHLLTGELSYVGVQKK